ncbi:polysaccharide deacetylase family protein [Rhodonellum sp.]|uniref:polysaccharide deacetylase family protein n=1 Tax=Rhodonellum sp. TaxID=2231180 RepID=UPI00271B60D0|nr:polysaccharide deacetylase family protein [Rhodonellum sp.]MDO9551900.1 polysaccharide deacetylase family protein [Rhodonellum sp.]
MLIHHVPSIISSLLPQLIWNKDRQERKVYLTFDDGPVPGVTDYVLEMLDKRKMKATFFMVGDNIRKNPMLAKEVLTCGHKVGNHTYHHLNGFQTKEAVYLQDIEKCQETIGEHLGIFTDLFRPPYGRMTRNQHKKVNSTHQVIMWDVLSGDFDLNQPAEKCLQKTIKYTKNGSIVVFHDQVKTKGILKRVLNPYLDFVSDNGFETGLL